jgi:hypothetical protein
MQLLNDPKNEGSFSVIQYGTTGHMYMSNSVLQALDIFAIGTENGN